VFDQWAPLSPLTPIVMILAEILPLDCCFLIVLRALLCNPALCSLSTNLLVSQSSLLFVVGLISVFYSPPLLLFKFIVHDRYPSINQKLFSSLARYAPFSPPTPSDFAPPHKGEPFPCIPLLVLSRQRLKVAPPRPFPHLFSLPYQFISCLTSVRPF